MADAYLLTTHTKEEAELLLPRGVIVTNAVMHGGAWRIDIRGKELVDGKGYQLVSTDGPLLRCIELVENPVEEDGDQAAELQARKKPKVVKTSA